MMLFRRLAADTPYEGALVGELLPNEVAAVAHVVYTIDLALVPRVEPEPLVLVAG